jgi:hypothetical protein
MDNAQILVNYCEKNLIKQTEYFTLYMKLNPSFIICEINPELLNDDLKKIKKNMEYLLIYQSLKSKNIMDEYKSLELTSEELVGIKGFFISDIYWPPNKIRIFNDIDLLTKPKNGFKVCKYLHKKGYCFQSWDILRYHFKTLGRQSYFNNKLHVKIKRSSYIIELHGNLNCLYRGYGLNFNTEKMVNDSIVKTRYNIQYRILSPIDNILYLMYHSIKHLSFIEQENAILSINVQKFYDVAQIIDIEKIEWVSFVSKAEEYHLQPYIVLFLRMFNDIFINKIPSFVFNRLLSTVNTIGFHWKHLFCDVIKIPAYDLILGNYVSVKPIYDAYNEVLLIPPKERSKVWKKHLYNCK